MLHVVEIGGIIISDKPSDAIKTYGLASCVAVTAYCRNKKIAGMIHISLPNAAGDLKNYKNGYFANIGLPIFLKKLIYEYSCIKEEMDLKIFGGAKSINNSDVFDIGSRNLEVVKEILNNHSFHYRMVATGGFVSRTVELSVESGEIKLSELPMKI